jgi:hypothetical protein
MHSPVSSIVESVHPTPVPAARNAWAGLSHPATFHAVWHNAAVGRSPCVSSLQQSFGSPVSSRPGAGLPRLFACSTHGPLESARRGDSSYCSGVRCGAACQRFSFSYLKLEQPMQNANGWMFIASEDSALFAPEIKMSFTNLSSVDSLLS